MKAITLWEPWATLVVIGAKRWEFRKWDFSSRYPSLVDQRIAIAAGVRSIRKAEIIDLLNRIDDDQSSLDGLIAKPALYRLLEEVNAGRPPSTLGHVLGDAIFRKPVPAIELFGTPAPADSDRFLQSRFAWPLEEVRAYEPPYPYKGHQGFWNCPAHGGHGARLVS